MSIIVYKEGSLYSDSQGEIYCKPWADPLLFQTNKIFISPCNRLMVAIVGECRTPKALANLFQCLINAAVQFATTGEFDWSIEDDERFLTDDTSFIAVTRDFVFTREGGKYSVMPEGMQLAFGSVESHVRYLLAAGFSASDAIQWAIDNNGTVSGTIHQYKQADLSPLLTSEIADVHSE